MARDRTELVEALQRRDVDAIATIVAEDPSVVRGDGTHPSPVLLAAYMLLPEAVALLAPHAGPLDVFEASAVGDVERLRELIAEDPDIVLAYAEDGFQPLGLAAFFGHLEAARLLLDHGADIDSPARNASGVYPINSAAASHSVEMVQLLVDNDADLDRRQHGGITALMAAVHAGDEAMQAVLLEGGATPDLTDDEGKTAADYAPS